MNSFPPKPGRLLAILIGLFLQTPLHAQAPGDERLWTGANGATFRGTYSRSLAQGGKIEFLTDAGKVVVVAFGNLSEKDQKVILGFEGGDTKEEPEPDPDAFKILPQADRKLIPERLPEDFGGTDDEAMVDALWVSLLWWNAFEVVPIPKNGDFKRKAEWLHKELTRHLAKGGKGAASLEDGKEGVEEYFEKRLDGIGACKVTMVQDAMTPEALSELAAGNDIAILKMSMTYASGNSYSICAALESVEKNGAIALHVFGKRFTGKMEVTKATEKQPPHARSYEVVLNDTQNFPEYYKQQEPRFYLSPGSWQGVLHLRPYIYNTPGEAVPIP